MLFITTCACWARAAWLAGECEPPRGRKGLKPGGRSRAGCGGGKGMPPWDKLLILIAPRNEGSGVLILAKVVMGVIRFGGRPGLMSRKYFNQQFKNI